MVTREKVKSEFQRKNSSLRIRLYYNFPDIAQDFTYNWTPQETGYQREGLEVRPAKLAQVRGGEEEEERGERGWPSAGQRGKADGQQDRVTEGTATLMYSPCKLSEMEPHEEQYWARRGVGTW